MSSTLAEKSRPFHQLTLTGVIASLRFPFALSRVNKRDRDFSPTILCDHTYLYQHRREANIRPVELQELAAQYQRKTDEELMRLALDSTLLTPEASSILNDELSRRRINTTERLSVFRIEEEQRKEEERKDAGKLFLVHPYGIGRKHFGKAEHVYDPEPELERFRTTVFIVLFWLPLIPTGTFFVERKRASLSDQMTVLKRLPLDWEQVLKVWIVVSGSLLALIWISKLLPRLLYR